MWGRNQINIREPVQGAFVPGVPISRIPLGYTVVTPGYLDFSGVRKHLMVIT